MMLVLACDKISKVFATNTILNQITFSVNAGYRLGIVGDNGAGKSTLLKIIGGLLEQDSGQVFISSDLKISYLPQNTVMESDDSLWDELLKVYKPLIDKEKELRNLEKMIADSSPVEDDKHERLLSDYSSLLEDFESSGGYSYESYLRGILLGLGFSREEFSMEVSKLSGGQKTRIALAKVLLEEADILLLDEPTNHLDLDSLKWLEDHLSSYPGTIVMVSHDRYFLDALSDGILDIEGAKAKLYEGNYSNYSKAKKEDRILRMKSNANLTREINRQKVIIERYRSYNTEKSMRAVRSREKMLDRMDKPEEIYEGHDIHFHFDIDRGTGQDVLIVNSLTKSFGQKELFKDISFTIKKGERIAIIGPNGCGKSTLLKIIQDLLPPTAGDFSLGSGVDIGYYDQELLSLDPNKTVIEEFWDSFPSLRETEVRNALAAALFRDDDVYKRISSLSGGEKGHLHLAKLSQKNSNFLILDEPTNHLDMASREELEEALLNFPGTILMVSHDRYFLNQLTQKVILMDQGGIVEYLGNYDDYYKKQKELELLNRPEEEEAGLTRTQLKNIRRQERAERNKLREQKEELQDLENIIHKLEARKIDLENLLADPDLYDDIDRMLKIQRDYESTKDELENKYGLWMELA